MSSAASLSAAISMECATGFAEGRGTVRRCAPISTGESTSVVSDTGWNSTESPEAADTGSGVAYFHPAGSFTRAV